ERGGSGRPHDAVIPLEGVFVPTSVALPGHLATVVNVQPECPGVPRQHAEIRDLPPAPAHRVDCAAHRAAGTDHPAAVADGAGPARVAALQSAEVRDDPRLPEHGVDSRARLQIADDLPPIVQGARVEAQRNGCAPVGSALAPTTWPRAFTANALLCGASPEALVGPSVPRSMME